MLNERLIAKVVLAGLIACGGRPADGEAIPRARILSVSAVDDCPQTAQVGESNAAQPNPPAMTASQLPSWPHVSDPADVIRPTWDGDPNEMRLAAESSAPLAAAGDSEIDILRRELREAVTRLNVAQQELQETRQRFLAQQTDADDGIEIHQQRISRLETAFDSFRRQLSREGAGAFPSARITGFAQLDDYSLYQEAQNKGIVGNGQNGVGFRRARVAIVGNVAAFTSYMLEVDFATAGRPSFFDVWMEQENVPLLGAVRAGQFLQPFSVDAMSGFRNLPFLERSLPFLAFVPFRRVGAMASTNTQDERTYLAYSIFRTGGFNNAPLGDSRFATDLGNQGGYSFSGRLTHLLWYDESAKDRFLWHVGASYDFSTMTGSSSAPFYQARTGPEFGPIGDGIDTAPATFGPVSFATANITPPNFVDTGRYQANSFNLLGAETVFQAGPFSFQSEFMATEVNSAVGPIWYTGAYGEVMYRLTGEHRGYDKRLASLKNPIPFTDFISLKRRRVQGWGAWEIAARLSYINLQNPGNLNGHYLSGTNNSGNGTLTDTTLGLTWFINAHAKMQLNWIHAMLENTSTVAGTVHGFSHADFLVSRLQFDF